MSIITNPTAIRRLVREITQLRNEPLEGIRVTTDEENMLDVTGIIEGPEGTPYAGGYFKVKFAFSEDFPAAPPKCRFITKIFHPNVSKQGEICVNTLKKDWKPEYGIGHILTVIKCLLIFPNPESALDEEAGMLLLENYDDYCRHARLITSVHATPRTKPAEFTAADSASTSTAATPAASSTVPAPTESQSATITPSENEPATTISGKPVSKSTTTNTSTPLQNSSSASNAPAPSPLSATTSNTTTKAVKRPASSALDKRKKALKRL